MIIRGIILALALASLPIRSASAHTLTWAIRAESADLTVTGGFIYDPHNGTITSWTIVIRSKIGGTTLFVYTPTNSHVIASPSPGETGSLAFEASFEDRGYFFTRTLSLTPTSPLRDAGNAVIPLDSGYECLATLGGDTICEIITSGHIDNIADVPTLSPLAVLMLAVGLVFVASRALRAL